MYGWRARIGLIVPSSNTTMEMEFHGATPVGVSIHTARMTLTEVDDMEKKKKAFRQMNEAVLGAAREVSSVEPKVIVYGCTLGGVLQGLAHDLEIKQTIEESTGITTVAVSSEVIDAMKILGINRVGMATPYTEEFNELEKEFIERSLPGTKVTRMLGLGLVGNLPKGRLDPSISYRVARDVDSKVCDGLFISCTNLRTFEIIDALEKDLDKPVVTSNQAALWGALRETGVSGPINGYGRLLREHL